jgi:anhydro-N-acetylmuramic acid kinase
MLLSGSGHSRVVLNLGGIANITVLGADGERAGLRYRARPTVCWTRGACVIVANRLIATAHLRPAATSMPTCSMRLAGRCLFRAAAAEKHRARTLSSGLAGTHSRWPNCVADVQATLLELTARSV